MYYKDGQEGLRLVRVLIVQLYSERLWPVCFDCNIDMKAIVQIIIDGKVLIWHLITAYVVNWTTTKLWQISRSDKNCQYFLQRQFQPSSEETISFSKSLNFLTWNVKIDTRTYPRLHMHLYLCLEYSVSYCHVVFNIFKMLKTTM